MTTYEEIIRSAGRSQLSRLSPPESPSVIDTLYYCYQELHPADAEDISAAFSDLYKILNKLSLQEIDAVIDKTCELCIAHGRSGFQEGIALGFRLAAELDSNRPV